MSAVGVGVPVVSAVGAGVPVVSAVGAGVPAVGGHVYGGQHPPAGSEVC